MHLNWPELNERFNSLTRFKEIFTVGDYYVQPHVMHVNVQPRAENNPWHLHRTLEYSLLLSGKMIYSIDQQEIGMEQGDAIIIPSGLRHCWRVVSDKAITFGFMLYLSCQGEGSRQRLKQLQESITRHNYQVKKFTEAEQLIQKIISVTEKWDSYTDEQTLCLSRETYIELFKRIGPKIPVRRKRSPELRLWGGDPRNIIEEVSYYVRDNAHRPLRPAEICRHIGMNINNLNRFMKENGMRSVGQTIIYRKLSVACNLLDNSNRLVKDIAASLGFDDFNYFCRLFKKNKGMSPSEYRMKKRL